MDSPLPPGDHAEADESVERSPDVLGGDLETLCGGAEGVRDEPRGLVEDGRAGGVVDAERDGECALSGHELGEAEAEEGGEASAEDEGRVELWVNKRLAVVC